MTIRSWLNARAGIFQCTGIAFSTFSNVLPAQPVYFVADIVVRLTGDCPLADWELIDQAIDAFQAGGYDYLTNAEPPTYPDGLDVEVVSEKALLDAAVTAQLPSEREHVTLFIRNHPERFNIGRLTQSMDLSFHRWTGG